MGILTQNSYRFNGFIPKPVRKIGGDGLGRAGIGAGRRASAHRSAEGAGQRHWLLIRASGYPVDPLSRIPLPRNRRSFGGSPNHSYSSTAI